MAKCLSGRRAVGGLYFTIRVPTSRWLRLLGGCIWHIHWVGESRAHRSGGGGRNWIVWQTLGHRWVRGAPMQSTHGSANKLARGGQPIQHVLFYPRCYIHPEWQAGWHTGSGDIIVSVDEAQAASQVCYLDRWDRYTWVRVGPTDRRLFCTLGGQWCVQLAPVGRCVLLALRLSQAQMWRTASSALFNGDDSNNNNSNNNSSEQLISA